MGGEGSGDEEVRENASIEQFFFWSLIWSWPTGLQG